MQPSSVLESLEEDEEEDEDGKSGYALSLSWTKRHQELGTCRLSSSKGAKTISTTVVVNGEDVSHNRLSNWRRLWAAGVAAVLLWDCISLPLLALSFHEPWVMELLRIIFWTLSLPMFWTSRSISCCSYAELTSLGNVLLEVVLLILLICAAVAGSSPSVHVQFLLRGSIVPRFFYRKFSVGVVSSHRMS